jgi:hypothetical protein
LQLSGQGQRIIPGYLVETDIPLQRAEAGAIIDCGIERIILRPRGIPGVATVIVVRRGPQLYIHNRQRDLREEAWSAAGAGDGRNRMSVTAAMTANLENA